MKITALHEGVYAVDDAKVFTLTTREEKRPGLIMGICPFLVETGNSLVLLDTGLSLYWDEKPLLADLIEKAGYAATQVDHIFLSHLHKDHIDGLGTLQGDLLMPHFPLATVHIQQREYDFALTQHEKPSYHAAMLDALPSLPSVHWMQEDTGTITEHISFEVTGGHSPFHQVCWIKEADQIAFYGADNLPQLSYLKPHIAYKTDFDGKKAMQLRQEWEVQAKAAQWDVLFYHGVRTTITRL